MVNYGAKIADTAYAMPIENKTFYALHSFTKSVFTEIPSIYTIDMYADYKAKKLHGHIRDVELKDFSFDSQLSVPKIVRESGSQRPCPKIV